MLFSLKVTKQTVQQAQLPVKMKRQLTKKIEALEKKIAKGKTNKIPKILDRIDTFVTKKTQKRKMTPEELATLGEIIQLLKTDLLK